MTTLLRFARALAACSGLAFAAAGALAQTSSPQPAGETPWPYAVKVDAQTSVLVYPPQLQSWSSLE